MVENQNAAKGGEQKVNLGVEEIKNAVGFGIQLSMTLSEDLADKKITLAEAFALLPLVMQIPEIVNKLPQLKAEWVDRDPAELAELSTFFKDKFALPNDKVEAVIEGAIDVVIAVVNEISLLQALKPATPPAPTPKQ